MYYPFIDLDTGREVTAKAMTNYTFHFKSSGMQYLEHEECKNGYHVECPHRGPYWMDQQQFEKRYKIHFNPIYLGNLYIY